MYPLIKSRDIAAFKAVESLDFIVYGEIYIVPFTKNNYAYLVIKYIPPFELDKDHIKLVSYSSHHQPLDSPLRIVNSIALVKFSVRTTHCQNSVPLTIITKLVSV